MEAIFCSTVGEVETGERGVGFTWLMSMLKAAGVFRCLTLLRDLTSAG